MKWLCKLLGCQGGLTAQEEKRLWDALVKLNGVLTNVLKKKEK
jgi:hypothetical protein